MATQCIITNTDLSSMRCVVVLLEVEFCKRLCLLNSKFSALMLEAGCHSRCLFGFLNLCLCVGVVCDMCVCSVFVCVCV